MKLILPLLFLGLFCGIAHAETSAELLAQLRNAVKAEAKAASQDKNPTTTQRAYQLQEALMQFGQSEEGEYSNTNLIRVLDGIEAASASDSVTGLCRTLSKQLRAEQVQKESALLEEMQKDFTSALQAGLAAKTAKDLDAPLATVTRLAQERNSGYSNNPKLRNLASQGQQVLEFLKQWQDYLAGVDNGESGTPRVRLRNLLNSSRDFSAFMPRSELLARMAELQGRNVQAAVEEEQPWTAREQEDKAREIVAATHGLKEMGDTIRKLDDLSKHKISGAFSNYVSGMLQSLRNLQRIYLDLDNGLAATIHLSTITTNYSTEGDDRLASLRVQLLLYALPRVLGLGEADAAQPGDNVATYLNRIATRARENSDWPLLSRTVDVAQTLNIGTSATSNDRTALQSFLGGVNQERARQYALAVSSFQAALKAGSPIVSAEMIGDHLEAIRKAHPQEFEQGMQMTLNPSIPADPRFADPRYRMVYPPAYAYPPGAAVPTPPPSITVPAVPAKSAVTPSPQPPVAIDAAKPR